MEFQLLGPFTATNAGRPLELGRRQERLLLCLLLLEAGRVVPADRLRHLLWGDSPPATDRATLHTYVARLRGRLSPHSVALTTVGTGYTIEIDRLTVDVHQFVHAVAQAPYMADPASRSSLLQDALNLWRGPLMEDVADDDLRGRLGVSFADQRLLAYELKAEADLACRRDAQVAGSLAELVAEHPTRERLVEYLMLALYRSGRQSEALAAYRNLRHHLVTELGLEPRPELVELHQQILVNDPALALPKSNPSVGMPRVFLPRDIPDFTGRAADLDTLDEFAAEHPNGTVLISAIAGIGGVGKTALAVRWAHRSALQFPDGQLYVNLRGYSGHQPVEPVDALRQLLRALGASDERIPSNVDEASALYRSTLAHRKMLILLDNASSVEQVRPLLPSGGGNLALVTSRDRLAGLIAMDGARRLTLGILSPTDAADLLSRVIGESRVALESEAAQQLVEFCGHLPLALRIAAANIVDNPQQTIADYLTMARTGDRLAALAVEGDPNNTVAAVFHHSFRALDPAEQRMFRLLGLLNGADFSADVVAALADLPETNGILDRLAQAQLINEHVPGRFTMHDLMREYAAGLSSTMDNTDVATAQERLADWCLSGLASTQQVRWEVGHLAYPRTFASKSDRLSWLDAEVGNIGADLHSFAKAGLHVHNWKIAFLLRDHFQLRDRSNELFAALRIGLASSQQLNDPIAEALMHSSIGLAYCDHEQYQQSSESYIAARQLYEHAGDKFGAAICDDSLGEVYRNFDDLATAEDHHQRAQAVPDYIAHPIYGTHSHIQMGILHTRLGRFSEAVQQFQLAIDLAHSQNLSWFTCIAYHRLAETYWAMDQTDDAIAAFRSEIDLAARTQCTDREPVGWEALGDCLLIIDRPQAMDAYQRALDLYDRFSQVRADRLRARLR